MSQQSLSKSNSKHLIKFEKRRLDDKPITNFNPLTTLVTPINGQLTKLTSSVHPPSSTYSKSSKLASECSSYRKQKED